MSENERQDRQSGMTTASAIALFMLIALIMATPALAPPVQPSTFTPGPAQRRTINSSNGQSIPAYAGNVTRLTVGIDQLTDVWQGYFGTVSGLIVLDDAYNNSIYTWNLTTTGEIYAAWNASTPVWSNITCFNLSQEQSENDLFNIPLGDIQNITNTFNRRNAHPSFTVGTKAFTASQCNYSVTTYVDDAGPGPKNFNETILWSPGLTNEQNFTVYMAYINNDQEGFNASLWDFQMLVPEDGWNGTTAQTLYYFYVELQ